MWVRHKTSTIAFQILRIAQDDTTMETLNLTLILRFALTSC